MNFQRININLPKTINPQNDFCTLIKNPILRHKENDIKNGIGWVDISHDGYLINTSNNNQSLYTSIVAVDESFDELIEDEIFFLYDESGLNYIHHFFNFFGRCLYFDELLKTNPKLKLGILEDYYQEKGNSSFIKQWLDLYYQDKNIEIIVFKKHVKYKISNLILPNLLYGFPMSHGDDLITDRIVETVSKVPAKTPIKNGCYISRQDTIKRGWYHSRNLINELELIDKIKNELDYDIIELMDHDIVGKIQIFKSYKNIIQQSSASNINLLFSTKDNTNIIITHPKMEGWLGYKCQQFSNKSKTNLISLDGGGVCVAQLEEGQSDPNNLAWELFDIDSIIEVLKQIDKGEI
jgi:hypothetical protein